MDGISEYDMAKLKKAPTVEVNIKYIKEKDLWVVERTETTFFKGTYLEDKKAGKWDKDNKSSPQKPVTQAPQRKMGQFDDFE